MLNPESMQPTLDSKVEIVQRANKIIHEEAYLMRRETKDTGLRRQITIFIQGYER